MATVARVSKNFRVIVTCEACQHVYEYDHTVEGRSTTGDTSSAFFAQEQLKEQIAGKQFGVMRCPRCRFMQSWMIHAHCIDRFVSTLMITVFIIGVLVAGFHVLPFPLGHSPLLIVGGVIGYLAVSVGITSAIMAITGVRNPNRKWHKEHGQEVPPRRSPTAIPM